MSAHLRQAKKLTQAAFQAVRKGNTIIRETRAKLQQVEGELARIKARHSQVGTPDVGRTPPPSGGMRL